MPNENSFQAKFIKDLQALFPDAIIIKNDPNYIQAIPDLLILYKDRWATLECKKSSTSHRQPNQKHYVEKMDRMSFSRFIEPENKEEVLNDLQQSFES